MKRGTDLKTPIDPAARPRWEVAGICAALVTLVFVVFGQTVGFKFINFDDGAYVYDNPIVSNGLSLSGIEWAFTHVLVGHWHPLTTIVLMTDCQIFGLWPGGHHLVNVLFHSVCVVFLFLWLQEMTGAVWRSAFAAAVFAVHPLRAESVAWVAECKDVLSGMFFMLTVWAYVRYVKSRGSYIMILLWFALGLLSKPMLVTLPCVLLLLDYWPLGRLQTLSQFPRLLREKVPLFVLTALSSFAAIFALKSGEQPTNSYPANAPIAYVTYLWKSIYPVNLALLYPLPKNGWLPWEVADAILLLAALTVGAWILRRRQPFLITGWFWYLGMLVPVIGIMQTGDQAYADRYTYLPQVGLCFAGTWAAADWAARRRFSRAAVAAVAGVILCALLAAGWHQVTYWRNSEILWTHSLECTTGNSVAHDNLGNALLDLGHIDEAIAQHREAILIDPLNPEPHNNLGYALYQEGRLAESIAECGESVRLDPNYAEGHNNLGFAMFQQGRVEDAIAQYRYALKIKPLYAEAHNNLGNALLQQGHNEEAAAEFREAIGINPSYAEPVNNLGNAFLREGRVDEAIAQYRAALKINPAFVLAHNNLGNALIEKGDIPDALAAYEDTLRYNSASVEAQNAIAWMLATAQDRRIRNGPSAVEHAVSANMSTGGNSPIVLRTLAAAYAQAGDFPDALKAAHHALQLAQKQPAFAANLQREIKLYEAGRPFENAH